MFIESNACVNSGERLEEQRDGEGYLCRILKEGGWFGGIWMGNLMDL